MEIEAVSVNGNIYPPEQAFINAIDREFMFGHGAFETFRVSDGGVFLLDEHFARLEKNIKALGIDWEYDPSKHLVWISDLTKNIPSELDGRVRFCVTSGDGEVPSVIIYLSHLDKFSASEKPAQILETLTRHKPEYFDAVGFRIKSLEYSYLYLAKKELPEDETIGILMSPDGYVAEALTSNIFWAKDDKLYTAPLSLGILAGTMRGWLIKRFQVEEKLIKQEDLLEAEEIFFTAGASYLVASSLVNGKEKPGINGGSYKKIYDALSDSLIDNQISLSS